MDKVQAAPQDPFYDYKRKLGIPRAIEATLPPEKEAAWQAIPYSQRPIFAIEIYRQFMCKSILEENGFKHLLGTDYNIFWTVGLDWAVEKYELMKKWQKTNA